MFISERFWKGKDGGKAFALTINNKVKQQRAKQIQKVIDMNEFQTGLPELNRTVVVEDLVANRWRIAKLCEVHGEKLWMTDTKQFWKVDTNRFGRWAYLP